MDPEEYARQMEEVKGRLYRIALAYLGEEHLAVEAVAQAIYLGFRGLKKLKNPEYLLTWETRILINVCKREWKQRKKFQLCAILPEAEYEERSYDDLPLKQAIGELPDRLRDVIILRYFSDYTLSDTAQALGIPQGTVVTRQRKALKLLKLELGEEG